MSFHDIPLRALDNFDALMALSATIRHKTSEAVSNNSPIDSVELFAMFETRNELARDIRKDIYTLMYIGIEALGSLDDENYERIRAQWKF